VTAEEEKGKTKGKNKAHLFERTNPLFVLIQKTLGASKVPFAIIRVSNELKDF
jgi:hypothetical protein